MVYRRKYYSKLNLKRFYYICVKTSANINIWTFEHLNMNIWNGYCAFFKSYQVYQCVHSIINGLWLYIVMLHGIKYYAILNFKRFYYVCIKTSSDIFFTVLDRALYQPQIPSLTMWKITYFTKNYILWYNKNNL